MRWTKQQDIMAYYLYRNKGLKTRSELNKIGEKVGIEPGALGMRMGNFQFLDGKGGLNKPANMSKATFEEYQQKSLEELGNIVSKFL